MARHWNTISDTALNRRRCGTGAAGGKCQKSGNCWPRRSPADYGQYRQAARSCCGARATDDVSARCYSGLAYLSLTRDEAMIAPTDGVPEEWPVGLGRWRRSQWGQRTSASRNHCPVIIAPPKEATARGWGGMTHRPPTRQREACPIAGRQTARPSLQR